MAEDIMINASFECKDKTTNITSSIIIIIIIDRRHFVEYAISRERV